MLRALRIISACLSVVRQNARLTGSSLSTLWAVRVTLALIQIDLRAAMPAGTRRYIKGRTQEASGGRTDMLLNFKHSRFNGNSEELAITSNASITNFSEPPVYQAFNLLHIISELVILDPKGLRDTGGEQLLCSLLS